LALTKTRKNYLKRVPVKDTLANRQNPFAPRFWEERLSQPLRWKTPMRIFVNSMSDVFHAHFSLEMIRRVFEVMNQAHWHDFQVLTKRPERALRYSRELPWSNNIWIGTSIESMNVAARLESIRQIREASVRFVSAEPLLGDVSTLDLTDIQWVIGGGESGAGFRAPEKLWARALRDSCREQGVAFLWKQWGGRTPKAGGRRLDGRYYDQYPRPHPGKRAAIVTGG
jgi:protein gp37